MRYFVIGATETASHIGSVGRYGSVLSLGCNRKLGNLINIYKAHTYTMKEPHINIWTEDSITDINSMLEICKQPEIFQKEPMFWNLLQERGII